jgi:hypothetical protein
MPRIVEHASRPTAATQSRSPPRAHTLVDLLTRSGDVERRAAHPRQPRHPFGVIALVQATDEAIAGAERASELGSAGQSALESRLGTA